MLKKNSLLVAILVVVALGSCTEEKEKEQDLTPSLTVPSFYDSTNYNTNVTSLAEVRTKFDALVNEIKKGRTTGTTVTESAISGFYSPTISQYTTAHYNTALTSNNGWFKQLADASGNTFNPDSTTTQGGTYGGYLFNEDGFEPEQMIEKGLFGAALSNQAISLISGNTTLEKIDQAIYVFGSTPHFKSSNAAKHGTGADKYLAVYMARRDKNDGNGIYTAMMKNFIKLQAAVKGGASFNTQRDAAAAEIKLAFEKANFATVINYCQSSLAKLSATTVSDADKAGSLHAIGECLGFVQGWKTVQGKKITDAEIDEIYTLLNGNSKPLNFITDRVNEVNKLQLVINKIQTIYGFSAAEIEDFKKNWVAEQNR